MIAPAVACVCGALVGECLTPIGEGAVLLCWLCAHDVVAHDATLDMLPRAACRCARHEIYPPEICELYDRTARAMLVDSETGKEVLIHAEQRNLQPGQYSLQGAAAEHVLQQLDTRFGVPVDRYGVRITDKRKIPRARRFAVR